MSWGVNGETGDIADMQEYGVWEAYSVKAQTYKTAIEVCFCHCWLLFSECELKFMFAICHRRSICRL